MGATSWIWRGAVVGAVGLAGLGATVLGYRLVRADVESAVYRDRLAELGREYDTLRTRYNEVVRKTAVTELRVADTLLTVIVRTADGDLREIPTPFDPKGEIYVDYVVVDGRLWIRRVFDQNTPPGFGLVIDPDRAQVDWADPSASVGKAVYRQLDEGRWAVTVTGQGSLGLVRVGEADDVDLARAPEIKESEPIEDELQRRWDRITAGQVLRRMVLGE